MRASETRAVATVAPWSPAGLKAKAKLTASSWATQTVGPDVVLAPGKVLYKDTTSRPTTNVKLGHQAKSIRRHIANEPPEYPERAVWGNRRTPKAATVTRGRLRNLTPRRDDQ